LYCYATSSVADAFKMMPGCGALPVVDQDGLLVDGRGLLLALQSSTL
jgi:hypothetical protein